MTFPLYFLLYPFGVFALIWVIFSLIGVYHMFKFGFKSFFTFFYVFIYLVVSALLLYISYSYIMEIDWQLIVTLPISFGF